ncbi:hypothetical protein D6C77_05762 [Aureobasidium pullulans]|nr:hypothetical protein D6C77_05762 [Aureobasidium pullulans]
MIQVITAYTYQQEYSGKHMHDSRLKNLRQRGSRFTTLVKAFGHKSVLLLMPCASFVRMKNEQLDVLPSKMETQEDFKNLKEQLDRYEKLAQKLIDFVKTVSIALKGRLLLSLAENSIVCESLQEAESLLSEWEKKSEQATPLEVQVLRMKNTVVGRISRYKGDFKHAAECLETCLKGVQTEAARYHVEYHLADVYCELRNPDAAQRLLEGDVARLKDAEIRVSKPLRRLLLPLAETLILQDRWKEAESELTSLARMFDEVACSDTSDQLGHVRSIIGLARIDFHHRDYDSTIIRTEKALKLVQYYDTFAATSFYSWFLYRFQASTYHKMRNFGKANESLDLSNRYDEIPRHYMTGLGTYAMDLLESDQLEVPQQYEYQRDA